MSGFVSLRDLGATILDLAGLDTADWPGQSLGEYLADSTATDVAETPVFAELKSMPDWWPPRSDGRPHPGERYAVFLGRWHYLTDGYGGEELYDVARDRAELNNLAKDPRLAEVVDGLRRAYADAWK
jgi:arylsulfatase A-like enzyme